MKLGHTEQIKVVKNTSLQQAIAAHPALAAQLLKRYGKDRFQKIAPNFKAQGSSSSSSATPNSSSSSSGGAK